MVIICGTWDLLRHVPMYTLPVLGWPATIFTEASNILSGIRKAKYLHEVKSLAKCWAYDKYFSMGKQNIQENGRFESFFAK
jgi:hypothetical protein